MIGIALGWKYAHHPGIKTKGDKIVAWPSALGTKPTQSQIEVIKFNNSSQAAILQNRC